MILRARIVVSMDRPPLEDGVVCISGDRIEWVGPRSELPGSVRDRTEIDLGESVLLPGLVNAHCHLDYTDLAGTIPPPHGFTQWIQAMVGWKANWGLEDFAASWKRGADMLLQTGTTTVGDVEAMPELLPAMWAGTPLRVISFRELIHLKNSPTAASQVQGAVDELLRLPQAEARVGLSPHATYTTSAELLEQAAQAAHRHRWRLVTHVAESEQEFEMFMYRHGPMHDWLRNQRDMSDCGLGSPVEHLERCDYLEENVLAVHANYLGQHDAGILARSGASVVHCPRSHDYFRHLKFPRADLAAAGVNLCLGTDSLATVRSDPQRPPVLSLFAEMEEFSNRAPEVSPETVLQMTTRNGAKALGLQGEVGQLSPGARADLIVLPYPGAAGEALEAIVHHQGPVPGSMIGGVWVIRPGS
jgi:cytosine/adenosine deaminase-related metal-dependent hydrolase